MEPGAYQIIGMFAFNFEHPPIEESSFLLFEEDNPHPDAKVLADSKESLQALQSQTSARPRPSAKRRS